MLKQEQKKFLLMLLLLLTLGVVIGLAWRSLRDHVAVRDDL